MQIDCPSTWVSGASIAVLGEAPGAQEVEQREGFVGNAGKLLNKMLAGGGLDREQVSLANVVKRRPPENNFAAAFRVKRKPTEELLSYRALLAEELQAAQRDGLRVIVACGNEALDAVMGLQGITARRGSAWRRPDGLWVVAALHPAAILRAAAWEELPIHATCVYARARWLAAHADYAPPSWEAQLLAEEEMVAMLGGLRHGVRWSVDLETVPGGSGKPGKISLLGVALEDGEKSAMIGVCRWPGLDVMRAMRDAVERCGREGLVGHGFGYDVQYLRHYGGWPRNGAPYMDTMQRWHGLFAELPKALEFASMWAHGHALPYWKDEGRKLHKQQRTVEEEQAYLVYNAKDCLATLWLSEWIEQEEARVWPRQPWSLPLPRDRWAGRLWELSRRIASQGVRLDPAMVKTRHALGTSVRDGHEQRLAELAPGVNPRSSSQVMKLLYETLKLPPQKKGKSLTADAEAVATLRRLRPDQEILTVLAAWREAEKELSSYLGPMLAAAERDDHMLYCGFAADATETYRWASSTHPLGGGLNLQTMPESLRDCIIADPGRVFIQPDLSQADARSVAWRANDTEAMALFSDPTRSIHLEKAREIFGEVITKSDPRYRLAKSVVHAGNYREGPKRLALQLGIPYGEAVTLLRRARARMGKVLQWHRWIEAEVRRTGMLTAATGHVRRAYRAIGGLLATGSLGDADWKELIAWEPQLITTQVLNVGMIRLQEIAGEELLFHQQGHDSFLCSVPRETAPRWISRIRNLLAYQVMFEDRVLIIPSEIKQGERWGRMELVPEEARS